MNTRSCEQIREALPLWVLGEMDSGEAAGVEAHLSSCPDCAAEEVVIRRLLETRPEPPAGLEERIRARVREEFAVAPTREGAGKEAGVVPFSRRRRWTPAWALSAAAVVILSLGIGIIWNGEDAPEVRVEPVQVASEEPIPEAWLWDDGMVAGAPVFDDLTDAELEALIQEMER